MSLHFLSQFISIGSCLSIFCQNIQLSQEFHLVNSSVCSSVRHCVMWEAVYLDPIGSCWRADPHGTRQNGNRNSPIIGKGHFPSPSCFLNTWPMCISMRRRRSLLLLDSHCYAVIDSHFIKVMLLHTTWCPGNTGKGGNLVSYQPSSRHRRTLYYLGNHDSQF